MCHNVNIQAFQGVFAGPHQCYVCDVAPPKVHHPVHQFLQYDERVCCFVRKWLQCDWYHTDSTKELYHIYHI
jgi:hypothetical protein